MENFKEAREFFGLVEKATGKLVRIEHDQCDYGGRAYPMLSNNQDLPVFEAKSESALELVLFDNTPGYNACTETPNWGPFRREDLVTVKVRTSIEYEPIELKEPIRVKTQNVREIPYNVAKRYANGDFECDGAKSVVFWLVSMPEGTTLADMQQNEGKLVFGGDRFSRRKVYKAVAVPEDYADLVTDKNGALLLASARMHYNNDD